MSMSVSLVVRSIIMMNVWSFLTYIRTFHRAGFHCSVVVPGWFFVFFVAAYASSWRRVMLHPAVAPFGHGQCQGFIGCSRIYSGWVESVLVHAFWSAATTLWHRHLVLARLVWTWIYVHCVAPCRYVANGWFVADWPTGTRSGFQEEQQRQQQVKGITLAICILCAVIYV